MENFPAMDFAANSALTTVEVRNPVVEKTLQARRAQAISENP